jgi:ubiquinone/menaquinone biosynthesis C-methylase UbiE
MDDWRSYDGVAATYARVHAPRFLDPARDLVRLAEIAPAEHVLDVGTGTGACARAVAEVGATVVGADPSLAMLEEGDPGSAHVAAEAIDLPFRDGTFDAVTGNFVLAHFARIETAMYDMVRVTRRGGRLAFSTWADRTDAFQAAWQELVETVVPKEMLASSLARAIPNHDRFRDRETVEQTLHTAGLKQVASEARTYSWTYSLDEYLDGMEVWASGRFVRGMLGESGWPAFKERARALFADRFPDPLRDHRDVILAVGTKA